MGGTRRHHPVMRVSLKSLTVVLVQRFGLSGCWPTFCFFSDEEEDRPFRHQCSIFSRVGRAGVEDACFASGATSLRR